MEEIDAATIQEVTNWTLSDDSSQNDQLQLVEIYNQNSEKCFTQTEDNVLLSNQHNDDDDDDDDDDDTPVADDKILSIERWPPLGESASSSELPITTEPKRDDSKRIFELENEKDQLSSSLFALTSRFAQVQFRLHQIHVAKEEDRPKLLDELNELANKGCIDQHLTDEGDSSVQNENILLAHQQKVISELKDQLDDLEAFAFEQGAGALPQSLQLQKQQALLEQLASKLNLQLDEVDLAHTSDDALRSKVDDAVAEIVNPGIVKAKLVDHLQTQIQDLERFVAFLHIDQEEGEGLKKTTESSSKEESKKAKQRNQAISVIRRAMTLIHMFSVSQFGCGVNNLAPTNNVPTTKKPSPKYLITKLKQAVNRLRILSNQHTRVGDGESDSSTTTSSCDSDVDGASAARVDDEVTQAVRKDLCPALSAILCNGLVYDAIGKSSALMNPISCILPRSLTSPPDEGDMHAWELLVEYYRSKNGALLAKLPHRMLSRAFNLEDLVGGDEENHPNIHTARRSLLEAVNQVLSEHRPLKRSNEDMFKAFVCLGLNGKRLSQWLHIISHSTVLISSHYTDDSYTAKVGLDGVVTVISKLDSVNFRLPVDVAVRPFKNIRDAF